MQNDNFGRPPPPPPAPQPGYTTYNVPVNAPNNPQNYGQSYPQHQNPYQGPAANQVPISVPEPSGWWERNERNKPQSNAVGAAFVIFLSGGMNIALSIQIWSILYTTHLRISWFIGALIGAFIAAIVAKVIPKKPQVQFASVLVIVGGIIMAATRYNLNAMIASRYLDGIGNGIVFAPTLALTGEIAVKSIRGMIASSEQMCFSLGIFLQLIYASSWSLTATFTAIQMQGVLSIVFGLIAIIVATFLMVESPVELLEKGQEAEAIDVLRRLQKPHVVSTQTYQRLDELKHYLAENRELTVSQSVMQGLPALIRLCLYRVLIAMSISYTLFLSLAISSIKGYNTLAAWPYVTFTGLRYLGALIPMFLLDSFGRKKIVLIGSLFCSAMAFGFAAVFTDIMYQYSKTETLVFLFIFAFFAGIAGSSSSVYLSEAFPLAVKHYLITVIFMIEMLVHIIIGSCDYSTDGAVIFFYILGVAWLVYFLLGFVCLPETKQTTLLEAQQKFEGFISKGF